MYFDLLVLQFRINRIFITTENLYFIAVRIIKNTDIIVDSKNHIVHKAETHKFKHY